MSESDDASDDDFMESKRSVLIYTNFRTLINIYCILHSDSSPTQQFKPMDITFMNKRLKMKFCVKDKRRHEYFSGKIVSYDGMTGKYGAYFPSDGEVIFIEPNDKDVVYLD